MSISAVDGDDYLVYTIHMSPRSPLLPFRANDEDRSRIEYLKDKLALNVAGVLRLAIKRLFDVESKRDK